MLAQDDDDHPRYACAACDYEGDEYALEPTTNINNGSDKHDTAVCPECSGSLRLWITTTR